MVGLVVSSIVEIASPSAYWVPNGPLGAARLANRRELLKLRDASHADPANYLRLFQGYAVAHDIESSIIDMGPLPIPCGNQVPNLLILGSSGSGKTQNGTLPATYHAIQQRWMMVYINIKEQKQTRIRQEFARSASRSHEVKRTT